MAEQNGQQGRNDRCRKQLKHRLLGQHRIQDHHRRRRHDYPQRTARGDCARCQCRMITARQHLGHGDPPEGGRCCHARPADRAKASAGHNGRRRQTTTAMAEQRTGHVIDIRGQPACGGKAAHQHEQRDHRKIKRAHRRSRFAGEQRNRRRPADNLRKAHNADQRHRNTNRNVQQNQPHHGDTADHGNNKRIHIRFLWVFALSEQRRRVVVQRRVCVAAAKQG